MNCKGLSGHLYVTVPSYLNSMIWLSTLSLHSLHKAAKANVLSGINVGMLKSALLMK